LGGRKRPRRNRERKKKKDLQLDEFEHVTEVKQRRIDKEVKN